MKIFGFARSLAKAAGKLFCCSSRKIDNVDTAKPLLTKSTVPEVVSADKVKDDLRFLALHRPQAFLEVMEEAQKDQIRVKQLVSAAKGFKKPDTKLLFEKLANGTVLSYADLCKELNLDHCAKTFEKIIAKTIGYRRMEFNLDHPSDARAAKTINATILEVLADGTAKTKASVRKELNLDTTRSSETFRRALQNLEADGRIWIHDDGTVELADEDLPDLEDIPDHE